jgi:hypothetical protein
MLRSLVQVLPPIIAGLFGLSLLLFIIALHQLRQGRQGAYWRLRRQAGQRGGQLFLISIVFFGIALALAIFSGLGDLAYQRLKSALENSDPNALHGVALSTATSVPVVTTEPPPSRTPTSTFSPTVRPATSTATPSPPPTGTTPPSLTPTLTYTPSPTFENVLLLTPPTSAVLPVSDAAIEITAAALDATADGKPLNPGTAFAANVKRLYVFIRFNTMTPGVTWTRVLYRDGVPIQGQSYLWSLGTDGESYFFFGSADGYQSGHYQVKIFLSTSEISRLSFTLNE